MGGQSGGKAASRDRQDNTTSSGSGRLDVGGAGAAETAGGATSTPSQTLSWSFHGGSAAVAVALLAAVARCDLRTGRGGGFTACSMVFAVLGTALLIAAQRRGRLAEIGFSRWPVLTSFAARSSLGAFLLPAASLLALLASDAAALAHATRTPHAGCVASHDNPHLLCACELAFFFLSTHSHASLPHWLASGLHPSIVVPGLDALRCAAWVVASVALSCSSGKPSLSWVALARPAAVALAQAVASTAATSVTLQLINPGGGGGKGSALCDTTPRPLRHVRDVAVSSLAVLRAALLGPDAPPLLDASHGAFEERKGWPNQSLKQPYNARFCAANVCCCRADPAAQAWS